jgi:hypothetical protein
VDAMGAPPKETDQLNASVGHFDKENNQPIGGMKKNMIWGSLDALGACRAKGS